MSENEIKGGVDRQTWVQVFERFSPKERRWAFLAVKMAEHQQTFRGMAKRHKLSPWYLGACAQGKDGYSMTPKVAKALEKSLNIDLAPFLDPVETAKGRWAASKPKEESL